MVVKITEEQFIQEMWAKHPESFTTDGLRTIWDYVNNWDEGELFIPAEINKKFLQVELYNMESDSLYNRYDDKYGGAFKKIEALVENSEDFLKINDNEYIEIL